MSTKPFYAISTYSIINILFSSTTIYAMTSNIKNDATLKKEQVDSIQTNDDLMIFFLTLFYYAFYPLNYNGNLFYDFISNPIKFLSDNYNNSSLVLNNIICCCSLKSIIGIYLMFSFFRKFGGMKKLYAFGTIACIFFIDSLWSIFLTYLLYINPSTIISSVNLTI